MNSSFTLERFVLKSSKTSLEHWRKTNGTDTSTGRRSRRRGKTAAETKDGDSSRLLMALVWSHGSSIGRLSRLHVLCQVVVVETSCGTCDAHKLLGFSHCANSTWCFMDLQNMKYFGKHPKTCLCHQCLRIVKPQRDRWTPAIKFLEASCFGSFRKFVRPAGKILGRLARSVEMCSWGRQSWPTAVALTLKTCKVVARYPSSLLTRAHFLTCVWNWPNGRRGFAHIVRHRTRHLSAIYGNVSRGKIAG